MVIAFTLFLLSNTTQAQTQANLNSYTLIEFNSTPLESYPVPVVYAKKLGGLEPRQYILDASQSFDTDGSIAKIDWTYSINGPAVQTGSVYIGAPDFLLLRITDNDGNVSYAPIPSRISGPGTN